MARKIEWISWKDGHWAVDNMKLDTAQNNIAATVIENEDRDWQCTVSFTIPAGQVGAFAKAKAIVEHLVNIVSRQ